MPHGGPFEAGCKIAVAVEAEALDIPLGEGRQFGAVGLMACEAVPHPARFVIEDGFVLIREVAVQADDGTLLHDRRELPALPVRVIGPALLVTEGAFAVPRRSVKHGGGKHR